MASKLFDNSIILIVDDRPVNREILVTLLGYKGYRLLEAADGVEGLAVAKAEQPDLIITDILMPKMDGYEFVRQLRAEPVLAQTPIIFYTAHFLEHEARALAEACGVTHLLTRPSRSQVVLQTVEAALGLDLPPVPLPPPEVFDREHLRLLTDKLSQKVDQLKLANSRLALIVEMGQQLIRERDPEQVAESYCRAAQEIMGAGYADLGLLAGEQAGLRYFYASGLDGETASRVKPESLADGVIGEILKAERPYRQSNSSGDPVALGFSPEHPPIYSFLGAPIKSPAQTYGWLCLYNKLESTEFNEEDEQLVVMLTAQLAVAYENTKLYFELKHHAWKLEQEMNERQQAKAALSRSEERFRLLVEGVKDYAIVMLDPSGYIVSWNAGAERIKGYRAEEIIGRHFSCFYPEVDIEQGKPEWGLKIAAAEGRFEDEGWRVRQDGARFWANMVITALWDESGHLHGFTKVSRDMTEHKRAEQELRDSEARYRLLAENVTDLISRHTPEGVYLYSSPACRVLLGYELEELVGHSVYEFSHPEDGPDLRQVHAGLLAQPLPRTISHRMRHKAGHYLWFETTSRVIHQPDAGSGPEIVAVSRDISERKRLEEQFYQVQKMEAIGRLAGGVAHDFNNMLVVITGYSELLLDRYLSADAPVRKYVEEIKKAGERAAGLTGQLLAFSRQQVLQPQVLNLNEVMADTEKMLRRLIGEDIDLVTKWGTDLGQVKADPGQLEQIIMNLVVNARDAMPNGGKLIVETANVELDETYTRQHVEMKAGPYVMLAVSDTGLGMPAETQARIFEPFFTTKGLGKGTGLGLATVYGIVKQSGGDIWVYSEPGRGTTFKIYLPRADEDLPVLERQPGLRELPGGTETILLVEDEAGVRALARQVLELNGYTVVEASHGGEALGLTEQWSGPIHLLLTDVVMPGGLNGRELSERLLSLYPELKVLYMSGYTDDAIGHHRVLEPGLFFLQKPFTPATLARKVREVLDMPRQGPAY